MNSEFSVEKQLAISTQTEKYLIKGILISAYVIVMVSVLVLVGWYYDNSFLKSIFPDYISMKFNTAVAFFLIGICFIFNALYRLQKISNNLTRLISPLASIAALIGLTTAAEHIFSTNLGFDQFFIADLNPIVGTIPGRMALSTSIIFTLVGLIMAYQGNKERNPTIAQGVFLISLLIGYGSLLGYIFGVPLLSGFGKLNAMAIHTTVLFIFIGTSGLALYHDHRLIAIFLSPTPAGYSSRRLLPIIFSAPVVLGWIRWQLISEEWLEGPITTAIFITFFVALTGYIVTDLAWKIHEQYTLEKLAQYKIEKQQQTQDWRDRLINGLIHDLRTPLSSARITAQMFNRTENITASKAQKLSLIMIDSIDRSDRLLRNLLDSTKAEAGEVPHLSLKRVRLNDILDHAKRCVSKDPDLIEVICPKDIEGYWDDDAVLRITENLLSNAVKYGEGHKVISLKGRLGPDHTVSISVHNWGEPIPEEDQEKIFNIFRRKNPLHKIPGWGIGLSAVRVLTSVLGGRVKVSSSLRQGTTFIINLPLDSRAVA